MSEGSQAVFLSYASEDAAAVARIAEALTAAGVEVWFDRHELRGGDAWNARITQQIHDCRLFVAAISLHTESRDEGYFRREWALAVDRTRDMSEKKAFLLPVVVDQTQERGASVPPRFHDVQWTWVHSNDAIQTLVARITALLAAAPPESAPLRPSATPTPTLIPTPASASVVAQRPARAGSAFWVRLVAVIVILGAGAAWLTTRHSVLSADHGGHADKSIAVLPFVDMSEHRDQDYFSDGLSEELIDQLAQSPELKVIARTSSFKYKGKSDDVRSIATSLGVANVLEGSVRRYGDALRITAQLIRASDGAHLWSQSYDRSSKDLFHIQEEIAATVAAALKTTLGDMSQADRRRPTNPAAYDLVLKGDSYRGFNPSDSRAAIDDYRKAVEIDPQYALAWSRLAMDLAASLQFEPPDRAAVASQAKVAAQRSLALDDNLAEAHYSMCWVIAGTEFDIDAPIEECRRANILRPGIADRMLAEFDASKTGDVSNAIAFYRRALERDPKFATLYSRLANLLFNAGQWPESESVLRRLQALEPGFTGLQLQLVEALVFEGKPRLALAEIDHETDADNVVIEKALAFWALGRRDESSRALEAFQAQDPYSAAELHAYRGETGAAFDALDAAFKNTDTNLLQIKQDIYFKSLRADARYKTLLHKLKLPE